MIVIFFYADASALVNSWNADDKNKIIADILYNTIYSHLVFNLEFKSFKANIHDTRCRYLYCTIEPPHFVYLSIYTDEQNKREYFVVVLFLLLFMWCIILHLNGASWCHHKNINICEKKRPESIIAVGIIFES